VTSPGARAAYHLWMARAEAPDGTVYVVHIRWLPWGPKVRVRTWRLGLDSLQLLPFDGDEFGIFFSVLLFLLLIPVVLFLLPVVVLLAELAVLALIFAGLLLMRFAFGAPWFVDVRDVRTGELTAFRVDGYERAKQVCRDLLWALERGPLTSPPPGATLV
jgi:hypothetical protein